MSLQLLEYDPRGTFSHLLRLPTSNNNNNNNNDDGEEEELLYRKTLIGLSPSQQRQRKQWHKALTQSINEAISAADNNNNNNSTTSNNNNNIRPEDLPVIVSDLVEEEEEEHDQNQDETTKMNNENSLVTITRFFPCGSIADLISLDQSLPSPHECLLLLFKIIETLDNLHSFGLGHGNLKLENILFDETGKLFFTDLAGTATATPSGLAKDSIEKDIQEAIPECVIRLLNGVFGDVVEQDFISVCKSGEFGCDSLLQHGLFTEQPQEIVDMLFRNNNVVEEVAGGSNDDDESLLIMSKLANKSFQIRKPILMMADDDEDGDENEGENDQEQEALRQGIVLSSKTSPPKVAALSILRNTITTASHKAATSLLIGSHPSFSNVAAIHQQHSSSSIIGNFFPSLSELLQQACPGASLSISSSSPTNNNNSSTTIIIKISNVQGCRLYLPLFPRELAELILPNDEFNDDDVSSSSSPMIAFIQLHRQLLASPEKHFLWILENCDQSNIVLGDVGGSNASLVVQKCENCWIRAGPLVHLALFDVRESDIGAPCQFSSFQKCTGLNLRTLSPRCAEEVQQQHEKEQEKQGHVVRHLLFDCALPYFFAARCRFSGMPVLSSFLPPEIRQQQLNNIDDHDSKNTSSTAIANLSRTKNNLNFWLTQEWGRKANYLQLPAMITSSSSSSNTTTMNGTKKIFYPFALEDDDCNNNNNNHYHKEHEIHNNNNNNNEFTKCSYPLLISKSSITHDVSVEGNLYIGPDEASQSSITVVQSILPLQRQDQDQENENENSTTDQCCHAVVIHDWVVSVQLEQIHNAIILVCSARDFVSLENCVNCDVYVVSSRIRLTNCQNCTVFAYTSLEPPACINCENVLFSEFCLKLPNLETFASLTAGNNNNNNDQNASSILPISLTSQVQYDSEETASSCQYVNEASGPVLLFDFDEENSNNQAEAHVRFNPKNVVRACCSNSNNNNQSSSENDDTLSSPPQYLTNVSETFNENDAAEIEKILETYPPIMVSASSSPSNHYSIHDNSNAAIDRPRGATSLFVTSPSSSEEQQNLLRFDIFCVDCGHIQITEPLEFLRISHCRGGPLTILAPFVRGEIIIDNCANLTLMAACRDSLKITNSSFCEISLLSVCRPVISADCRAIELSPFNLSAHDLELDLQKFVGIVSSDDLLLKAINVYSKPRIVEDMLSEEEEENENNNISTSLSSSLCPIYHCSPPLLGVSLSYHNNNNNNSNNTSIPFIAEFADAVDDAANKNEPLQAFLVQNLMNLVPGLFDEDNDQKEETKQDNNVENTNQHSAASSALVNKNNNDDEDTQNAAELLKMLREQKKQKNTSSAPPTTNDFDHDSSSSENENENNDNENDGRTTTTARPVSAIGRTRRKSDNNNNNNNNNSSPLADYDDDETLAKNNPKHLLIKSLENVFIDLIVEKGIKKVLRSESSLSSFDEKEEDEEEEEEELEESFPAPSSSPEKSRQNEEWRREIHGNETSSSSSSSTPTATNFDDTDENDNELEINNVDDKNEEEQSNQEHQQEKSQEEAEEEVPSALTQEEITSSKEVKQDKEENEEVNNNNKKKESIKILDDIFSSLIVQEPATIAKLILSATNTAAEQEQEKKQEQQEQSSSSSPTDDLLASSTNSNSSSTKKPRPKPKRAPMAKQVTIEVASSSASSSPTKVDQQEQEQEKEQQQEQEKEQEEKPTPTSENQQQEKDEPTSTTSTTNKNEEKEEEQPKKKDEHDITDDDQKQQTQNNKPKTVGSLVNSFFDDDDDTSSEDNDGEKTNNEKESDENKENNNETEIIDTNNENKEEESTVIKNDDDQPRNNEDAFDDGVQNNNNNNSAMMTIVDNDQHNYDRRHSFDSLAHYNSINISSLSPNAVQQHLQQQQQQDDRNSLDGSQNEDDSKLASSNHNLSNSLETLPSPTVSSSAKTKTTTTNNKENNNSTTTQEKAEETSSDDDDESHAKIKARQNQPRSDSLEEEETTSSTSQNKINNDDNTNTDRGTKPNDDDTNNNDTVATAPPQQQQPPPISSSSTTISPKSASQTFQPNRRPPALTALVLPGSEEDDQQHQEQEKKAQQQQKEQEEEALQRESLQQQETETLRQGSSSSMKAMRSESTRNAFRKLLLRHNDENDTRRKSKRISLSVPDPDVVASLVCRGCSTDTLLEMTARHNKRKEQLKYQLPSSSSSSLQQKENSINDNNNVEDTAAEVWVHFHDAMISKKITRMKIENASHHQQVPTIMKIAANGVISGAAGVSDIGGGVFKKNSRNSTNVNQQQNSNSTSYGTPQVNNNMNISSSIVPPGLTLRPMINNASNSETNVFKVSSGMERSTRNGKNSNNNTSRKSSSQQQQNHSNNKRKSDFDDDDDFDDDEDDPDNNNHNNHNNNDNFSDDDADDDFDNDESSDSGGKLEDDFGSHSNNHRRFGSPSGFDGGVFGADYEENDANNDDDDLLGGNFWTLRDSSALRLENQGPSRDKTLSMLCFDKKIDDKLAGLRNGVLAKAAQLKEQFESADEAMKKLRAAVLAKKR